MPASSPQWPSNTPFRTKDGSWELPWYRWFTRVDNAINVTVAVSGNDDIGVFPDSAGSSDISDAALLIGIAPTGIPFANECCGDIAPIITAAQPRILYGTHADRLATYNPASFPTATLYVETDRSNVIYWVQPGSIAAKSGVVDTTSPHAVTWVSGDLFDTSTPAGTIITIAGVPFVISSVTSPTTMVLSSSIPTVAGATYSIGAVAYASWQYLSGTMRNTLANIPTLGTSDARFRFEASDYLHTWEWSGTAWAFAPGDVGSGFVSEGKPDGTAPNGGLWGLCDGSTYAVAKADATTSNITTINRTNDSFPQGSTTFGAKAAVRAKWEATAVTDDESSHIHSVDPPATNASLESSHTHQVDPPATVSGNDVGGGQVVAAGVGANVPLEPHTHLVDIAAFTSGTGSAHTHSVDIAAFNSASGSAHHHSLSDANAQLKAPSETNGGLPARVGVAYFMRR